MTVAVLDACVLYPAALRDVFLWLAAESVYQPRWTDAIHEEWMRAVLANRPDLTRAQLNRTRPDEPGGPREPGRESRGVR